MAYEWSKNPCEHGGCQEGINIPPGFRFCPTDEELIEYLTCKLKGLDNPEHKFIEAVNIYAYSPMELSEKYKLDRETEWYFFTPRSRKYPNGERPDRFAKDGYWKPAANGKPIRDKKTGKKIGNVRTLNFRTGFEKHKTDQKSEWLMQEYTLDRDPNIPAAISDKMLDKWVLVKIYRKRGASNAAEIKEPASDAPQPQDIVPFSTAQQLQLRPPQSLEGLQIQSYLSQPQPLQTIEPPHPSSFGYFNDMGLQGNQNFGINSGFPGQENQQLPSLPQMFGVNGAETAIPVPHPDGQSNGFLTIGQNETHTAAPHSAGQFYGPQTFGVGGKLNAAPHRDGHLHVPQRFGLNGAASAARQTFGVGGKLNAAPHRDGHLHEPQRFGLNGTASTASHPGGTVNDVPQLGTDGLNLVSHCNNNNQIIPHPANNKDQNQLSCLPVEDEWLDFDDMDRLISADPLFSDADFGDGAFSYQPTPPDS